MRFETRAQTQRSDDTILPHVRRFLVHPWHNKDSDRDRDHVHHHTDPNTV